MKLNLLVLTLLMTSLTTDLLPAAKRQTSGDKSDQEGQTPEKKARSDKDESAVEAAICVVCHQTEEDFGTFIPVAEFQKLLPCRHHQIHEFCLSESLDRSNRCPVCRVQKIGVVSHNALHGALHGAALTCNLAEVEALLAAGANVNDLDELGRTPLHLAALRCHPGVVARLIAAGANPNIVDPEGLTPLFFAITDANRTNPQPAAVVVQALIAAGANVNDTYAEEITPLHIATRRGLLPVVQALIAAPGINLDAVTLINATTPLHVAAFQGNLPIVQELLAAGADKTIRSRNGQTAADIARTPEIRALIEKYQAPADDGAATAD